MTQTRGLWLATAVLGTASLGFVVAPASVRKPEVSLPALPPVSPEKDASTKAEELLSFEEIPRSNVFSRSRTAPTTRYVPPGLEVEQPAPRPVAVQPPRLFGVASGPNGAVALIDADPGIPGAEIYRVGDRVRDARLIEIADTMVIMEGAGGRTVLRLPSSRQGSQ